jgi:hypothetical protein
VAYVFDQANATIVFFLNGAPVAMQTGISTVAGICMNETFNVGAFADNRYGMDAQLATIKAFAPGTKRELSAGRTDTIGVLSGTTMVFSPSLYFNCISLPFTPMLNF